MSATISTCLHQSWPNTSGKLVFWTAGWQRVEWGVGRKHSGVAGGSWLEGRHDWWSSSLLDLESHDGPCNPIEDLGYETAQGLPQNQVALLQLTSLNIPF